MVPTLAAQDTPKLVGDSTSTPKGISLEDLINGPSPIPVPIKEGPKITPKHKKDVPLSQENKNTINSVPEQKPSSAPPVSPPSPTHESLAACEDELICHDSVAPSDSRDDAHIEDSAHSEGDGAVYSNQISPTSTTHSDTHGEDNDAHDDAHDYGRNDTHDAPQQGQASQGEGQQFPSVEEVTNIPIELQVPFEAPLSVSHPASTLGVALDTDMTNDQDLRTSQSYDPSSIVSQPLEEDVLDYHPTLHDSNQLRSSKDDEDASALHSLHDLCM